MWTRLASNRAAWLWLLSAGIKGVITMPGYLFYLYLIQSPVFCYSNRGLYQMMANRVTGSGEYLCTLYHLAIYISVAYQHINHFK